jgi:hypothetical protein
MAAIFQVLGERLSAILIDPEELVHSDCILARGRRKRMRRDLSRLLALGGDVRRQD